ADEQAQVVVRRQPVLVAAPRVEEEARVCAVFNDKYALPQSGRLPGRLVRLDVRRRKYVGVVRPRLRSPPAKLIHRHDFANAEAYERRARTIFRGVYRRVAEDVSA